MKRLFLVLMILLCSSAYAETVEYRTIDRATDSMTDAQFDNYAESLIGTPVDWKGVVVDVKKNFFGSRYEVEVDMDHTGVFDVVFDVDSTTGLSLQRNQAYNFKGTITYVTKVLGFVVIYLEKVAIQ